MVENFKSSSINKNRYKIEITDTIVSRTTIPIPFFMVHKDCFLNKNFPYEMFPIVIYGDLINKLLISKCNDDKLRTILIDIFSQFVFPALERKIDITKYQYKNPKGIIARMMFGQYAKMRRNGVLL